MSLHLAFFPLPGVMTNRKPKKHRQSLLPTQGCCSNKVCRGHLEVRGTRPSGAALQVLRKLPCCYLRGLFSTEACSGVLRTVAETVMDGWRGGRS